MRTLDLRKVSGAPWKTHVEHSSEIRHFLSEFCEMLEDKKKKIKGFSKMFKDNFFNYKCGFRTKYGKNVEKY